MVLVHWPLELQLPQMQVRAKMDDVMCIFNLRTMHIPCTLLPNFAYHGHYILHYIEQSFTWSNRGVAIAMQSYCIGGVKGFFQSNGHVALFFPSGP